jgi:hypothetical protein
VPRGFVRSGLRWGGRGEHAPTRCPNARPAGTGRCTVDLRPMVALVAIEVPSGTPPDLVVAVTASCTAALGEGACEPTSEADSPRYFAVIRWSGPGSTDLRVELRERDGEGPTLDTRVILFTPADRLRQRWASAGLVVAALVVQREAGESPAAPPTPAPAPPPESAVSEPAPAPPPETPSPVESPAAPPPAPVGAVELSPLPASAARWIAVDVGGLLGPTLEAGSVRGGPAARIAWYPLAAPFAASAGLRLLTRTGVPNVTWLGADLGAVARLGAADAPLAAELRVAGAAERVFISAIEPGTGRRDVAGQWRLGGRLGVEGAAFVHPPLAAVVGGELSLLRPQVQIEVANEPRGTDPALGFSAWAGLRFQFGAGTQSPNLPAEAGPARL